MALSSYDPFATGKFYIRSTYGPKWPNPVDLGGRRGYFTPWRLEVVNVGAKGAYAYCTYDWFPHQLSEADTIESIIGLYKLPNESEEEFLAALKEENGVGAQVIESELMSTELRVLDFINNAGLQTRPQRLAVPRVIPLNFLQKKGTGGNIPPVRSPKKIAKGTAATLAQYTVGIGVGKWGTETSIFGYTRWVTPAHIKKLRSGISPMSRLFIFYLNNDYSPFSLKGGLGNILFKQNVLYKALTGKSWPGTGASPPGTTQERIKSGDRAGELNEDYLGPGDFYQAQDQHARWVEAYQTLYTTAWSGAQYVNVEKEAAGDEDEWKASLDEGYEGTINPALIPQTGEVKDRVFIKTVESRWSSSTEKEPSEYRIGQGFLSRITRRLSNGTQLSSIERAMGIPEPDIGLINIGKEVKRSIQQQRINLFVPEVSHCGLQSRVEWVLHPRARRGRGQAP